MKNHFQAYSCISFIYIYTIYTINIDGLCFWRASYTKVLDLRKNALEAEFCCYIPSFSSSKGSKQGFQKVPKLWWYFCCWFVEMSSKFSGISAWDQWNGFLGGLNFLDSNFMSLMFLFFAAASFEDGCTFRFDDVHKDLLLDQNRLRDLPEQVSGHLRNFRSWRRNSSSPSGFGLFDEVCSLPNLKSLSVSQNLLKRLPKAGRSFKRYLKKIFKIPFFSVFLVEVWIDNLRPSNKTRHFHYFPSFCQALGSMKSLKNLNLGWKLRALQFIMERSCNRSHRSCMPDELQEEVRNKKCRLKYHHQVIQEMDRTYYSHYISP